MVDAHGIVTPVHPLHPAAPETVSVLSLGGKIIDRHAPALAGFGEIIRRTAGDKGRISFFIQQKIFAMAPDIRTVQIHIERNISHDVHSLMVGIFQDLVPLLVKDEL